MSEYTIPTWSEFEHWPVECIAEHVRRDGPKVCVFPINGTRRWFMLEYPQEAMSKSFDTYLQIAGRRHVELYKLVFDHGIGTLMTPIFGPELLDRGQEYHRLILPGLLRTAEHPDFVNFYDAYDVRVRIYGDTERYLRGTPYEPALDAFAALERHTAAHERYRLFFGVCAHDPTETVAEIGVQFQREYGHLPNKRQIVKAYYGEYVKPVDIFIGFDRPTAFDMPLIATGEEDLYFTVCPSPYLDAQTLRHILYDHLYARRIDDSSYQTLSTTDIETLVAFYQANHQHVLGLGRRHKSGAFWYPIPQVEMISALTETEKQKE
jgi:tuberculosinol/isotuberculosinol synthase